MGLLDLFRGGARIRNPADLADFIDRNAAFVAQKGIYEYSRARAGHYAKVLFAEPEFHAACDESRWRAFPLGLAMVGELAEGVLWKGVLAESGHGDRASLVEAVRALVLAVFDRYPVPAALDQAAWRERRAELERRLLLIGLHAPKPAKDVSEPFTDAYVELMPIHEKLRGRDAPTLRNYLRVTMCNIHDELSKRLDAPAVAAAVVGSRALSA